MKKYFNYTFLVLFFLFFQANCFAQNFEGYVSFDIKFEVVPEEVKPYLDYLGKDLKIFMKGKKSCVTRTSLGGTTNNIFDNETEKGYITQDITGEKIAYEMTKSDYESQGIQSELTIVYSDETKEIAGYKCKKAELTYEGVEGSSIIWYTDEIDGGFVSMYKGLNGFPMEYRVATNGMTLLFTATKVVKETVSDAQFIVPEGYTIKPYSDLLKMAPKK